MVYQQILARLDGRGIRFVVDATRDLLVKVLPYHPFLIKPNNHELGEIFGKELNRDEEITQAARKLQQRGARNVLVSMAGDGALLLDETGCGAPHWHPKRQSSKQRWRWGQHGSRFYCRLPAKRELLLRPAPWHRPAAAQRHSAWALPSAAILMPC